MESNLLAEDQDRREAETKKLGDKARKLLLAYRNTFETEQGRIVFFDLLDQCHFFRPIFSGNNKMALKEGKRQIGLYLLSMREMASGQGIEKLKREMEMGEKEDG